MKRVFRIVHDLAKANALRAVNELDVRPQTPWVVTIEPERKKRSLDQNARYWGLLTQAAVTCGTDAEALHEMMKKKFLGYREVELLGTIAEIPNSTAKLKTQEFTAYMTQVETFLYSEGILQVW